MARFLKRTKEKSGKEKSGKEKSGKEKSGKEKSGKMKGPFYMEAKKNSKTKKIIILSLCVVTLVFVCILGTYAYFLTNVGNNNRQEVQLDTGTMRLRFADGNPTINQNIMLGETVEKKFTIENTGDLDASLSIEWLDIVNTYMEGSLTYILEQSETQDSGYTEIISKTNVPVTDTAFTTTLAPDLEVPTGKTYYYNLKITFNNLEDIDQEADRNAKLTTKFTVSQPSNNRSYSLVIDPNGGTLNGVSTPETSLLKNGTTKEIGTPKKAGMDFKGWKLIGMGSTLIDGTLTIGKSNTKLVAEWTESEASKIVKKIGVTPKEVTDTVPNFASGAKSNEGVYSMEDDYGTSYFYRGAVTNNYVKFGGFYWRIIRVNGDGSVRIIYDGTSAHANREGSADRFTHTYQVYSASRDDAKYVGWMYGATSGSKAEAQTNTESSDIKKLVDAWYKTNIVDKNLSQYVADSIFCNDRSTPGQAATGWSPDTGLGYGTNATAYGATARLGVWNSVTQPIFTCPQKNDAFTVSDKTKGNGALTYPVGLITADEIVAAGSGKSGSSNTAYYLYNPNNFSWSFSPANYGNASSGGRTAVMLRISGGGLSGAYVYITGAISPVINLTPDYFKTLIGDGTMTNPFRTE